MESLRITGLALALLATVASAQRPTRMDAAPQRDVAVAFDLDQLDLEQVASAPARTRLQAAMKRYGAALSSYRKGEKERSLTKRARRYRAASRGFERALRRVSRIERIYAKNTAVLDVAHDLRSRIALSARTVYLELAVAYTSRSTYKRALDAVEAALRIEPKNAAARALRRHVQLVQAAASRRR